MAKVAKTFQAMDYRGQFRFLPWLSAATAARVTSEQQPSRPEGESSASVQPRTTIWVQRPPFRPPGIAPTQAPRQAPASPAPDGSPSTAPQASAATSTPRPTSPTRAASVPPSPSRQATDSKTSQPQPATSTPRPTSPTRAASVPPSPSRQATDSKTSQSQPAPPTPGTTQFRVAVSQTGSPSPAATEPAHPNSETKAASVPSPSRQATESRTSQPVSPAGGNTQSRATVSQTRSPSRATTDTRATSVPPSPSRQATDSKDSQPVSQPNGATQTKAAATQTGSPSHKATPPKAPSMPPSPSQVSEPQATVEKALQVQSPSSSASQPTGQNTSPPSSPSHKATPAKAPSIPPSPSQVSEPQAIVEKALQVQSPSSSASQPTGQKTSPPSSPSRKETQMKATVEAVPQPQSPSKRSQTAKEESSKPASPTGPLSSQQKPELEASLTESLDAQPRTERISKGQEQPSNKTTIQPPLEVIAPEKAAAAALLKLDEKTEEKADPYKSVKEEKTKVLAGEEAQQRTTTKLSTTASDAAAKSKELPGSASEAGRIHQQEQEVMGRRTWKTTSGGEKDIKIVSSTLPKDDKMENDHHQKHVDDHGEQIPLHKGIKEDIFSLVQKLAKGHTKLPPNEKPISAITLAGDNKGASLQVGSESAKKDASVHIYQGYKLNPDESPDFTTDAEGSSRGRNHEDSMTEDSARQAYINSNMQGVNNSLMFGSSATERNPGVHLAFSQTFTETPESSAKTEPLETRKDEFNIKRAEKLTYEPMIISTCLRGLSLESSDSEPENPEKPQRHGSRHSCEGKGKEKEISVL